MRCGRVEELLPAHIAGELPPADARELERHLAACDLCRESFITYKISHDALKRSRCREVPQVYMQSFWPNVQRRIRLAERAKDERFRRIWEMLRTGWVPRLAGAACAAAGVLLAAWLFWPGAPAKTPPAAKIPAEVAAVAPKPQAAPIPGEVPFTALAKVRRSPQRFFVLPPLDRAQPLDRDLSINTLTSASLADRGATYTLPSARLASVGE